MSFNQKSAGGRVATDSAAQSGVNADSFNGAAAHFPHASAGACTSALDPIDVRADFDRRSRRLAVLLEATTALLEELRGCHIDRDDIIATFDLAYQLASDLLELESDQVGVLAGIGLRFPLRRIRFLSEAGALLQEQLRGVEINGEDLLALLSLIDDARLECVRVLQSASATDASQHLLCRLSTFNGGVKQ